ncbi:MAG: AAA family ATPase [Hyphomicrobiaceae bacterium]
MNQNEWFETTDDQSQPDGLRHFLRILKDGKLTLAACLCFCLILASMFLLLSPSYYVASATIMLQPPQREKTSSYFDDVRNQSQILQSTVVARRVVENLGLANSQALELDNKSFLKDIVRRFAAWTTPTGVKAYLHDAVSEPDGKGSLYQIARRIVIAIFPPAVENSSIGAAAVELVRNLKVRRVGVETRVLEVSYRSVDRLRAAMIADAFVEAYIADAREMSVLARQRGKDEMALRVSEAKQEFEEAERALDEFKSKDVSSIDRYDSKLGNLVARVDSLRALHENLMQRAIDLAHNSRQQAATARLLGKANVPKFSDQPRTRSVLGFAILFGLAMGAGAVLVRDYFSSGFKTGSDLGAFLRLPVFGELPAVKPTKQKSEPDANSRSCSELVGAARLVLDRPNSGAVDALALAQAAISKSSSGDGPRMIGVTSAVADEGRSTTCLNLAALLGASGKRVLIVDADWKGRGLSERLSGDPENGLVQVLFDKMPASEAVWNESTSGVKFLPAGRIERADQNPNGTLAKATRMASLNVDERLSEFSEDTDFVLVRLPPMSAMATTVWPTDWLDGILLVVRSERTPPETISEALSRSPHMSEKIVGGLLVGSRRLK